jgi:dephospho-CoA kinase
MKLWGLTGGIGMGKTTLAGQLLQLGVKVVDTDDLARQLVQPGQPALAEIQQQFGPELVNPEGSLRRDLLAARVFSDSAARRQLEGILHPRIRELWQGEVENWRQSGELIGVVVISLLFETQPEVAFEKVLCAACQLATQQTRLLARGWTPEQIELRRAAQFPIADKISRSQHVLWTEGELANTRRQLTLLLQRAGLVARPFEPAKKS